MHDGFAVLDLGKIDRYQTELRKEGTDLVRFRLPLFRKLENIFVTLPPGSIDGDLISEDDRYPSGKIKLRHRLRCILKQLAYRDLIHFVSPLPIDSQNED